MNRLQITDTYPNADELRSPFIEAVRARLASHVALVVLLGGANVNAGADPADKPANGKWVTASFERQVGSRPEHYEGWLTPTLWVKSECRRSNFTFMAAVTWHTEVHDEIAKRLLGYQANLSGGLNGGKGTVVVRESMMDLIEVDADDDTYYFASWFATEIIAAHAAA